MASVYVHVFPNNKLYIGMTAHDNPIRRWACGKGYKTQQLVYRAIEKYGWDNIQHIVLFSNIDLQVALEIEKSLICKYHTQNEAFGYNISNGGDTNAGYHHTEEYKTRLRNTMTGKYKGEKSPCYGTTLSNEQKLKISKSLTGHIQTPETCQKRSESLKGHIVTEATRRKISEAHKGKKFSELQCKRISEHNKGRHISEEHKQAISKANTGRPKSPETLEKLRISHLGKKHGPMSEEQKLKISLANKGRKKRKRT